MSSDPIPNLPLLRRVLRQIDSDPKHYNQKNWRSNTECGTAYCVGGWACVLSGETIEYSPDGVMSVNGDPLRPVGPVATELLGLKYDEMPALFFGNNTREDVERVAHQIAARAGEPLWPEPITTGELPCLTLDPTLISCVAC